MSNEKILEVLSDPALKKVIGKDDNLITTGKDEIDEGDIKPIPTSFLSLDLSIGIGGLPRGKIVEISGGEGTFKSALCWAIAGAIQKAGGIVAWIDAENAVDLRIPKVRRFLLMLGVNPEDVIIIRPTSAEQAFKFIEVLSKNGNVDYIVFDSIVALSNQREVDADMEKTDRNTLAMTINKGLRKCAPYLRRNDCTLMVINQLRVNQDAKGPFDEKWQTTGGKGLKHWASLRLYSFKKKIKNSEKELIGHEIDVTIKKTRFDNERDMARMFFYFKDGWNRAEELFFLAESWVFDQSKQSYIYNEHKMTKAKWLEIFSDEENNKELITSITNDITQAYEDYYNPENEESGVGEEVNVEELIYSLGVADLRSLAEELDIENSKKLKKNELQEAILEEEAETILEVYNALFDNEEDDGEGEDDNE